MAVLPQRRQVSFALYSVAAVVYTTTMAVNAYCWSALWLYASSGRRLLHEGFPEEQRRTATLAFTIAHA